ncbi:hypothetical protein F4777DRAFT_576583 [Nemania sp. FL0916]|nr:hypothetical protein F4777DRAFT_576583 [Nemania sp. FL0916]
MKGAEDRMETARFLDDVEMPEKARIEGEPVGWRKHFSSTAVVLHGFLIAFYTTIFLFLSYRLGQDATSYDASRVISPAWESINYEFKYFADDKVSAKKYFGEPNEEREALWEELLGPPAIRFTPEEIRLQNKPEDKTVQLPDGDYVGVINVFHDLHCLRRVGRMLYPDHYWPNSTSEEKSHNIMHSAHCLDRLRQTIQCQADISVVTFTWGKRTTSPLGNLTTPHECVNWDSLSSWVENRGINVYEPGLLTHPTLGPAYSDRNPDRAPTGYSGDEPI